jgi:subtilisin family serine protease
MFKVRNVVSPLIPAVLETSDPENVEQYDLFKTVRTSYLRLPNSIYPSINDPLRMVPSGYLRNFGYYLGIFSGPDLEFLYDSKVATNVWEMGFKRINQFPYVTDEQGIFSVKRSSWKGPLTFTSTYWVKKLIGADVANSKGYTGKGVKVAVVDTGGTSSIQTFNARRYTAVDQNYADQIGHGEWTISAAIGRTAEDHTFSQLEKKPVLCEGMAPDGEGIAIKALDYVIGTGTDGQLLHALDMAHTLGADVVSCSWGGSAAGLQQPQDSVFYKPTKIMVDSGQVVVFAAGNSGPNPNTIDDPGDLPDVLTVGAYNAVDNSSQPSFGPAGMVAGFSSRGPTNWGAVKPDIVMPGAIIDSAIQGWMMGSYTGITHPYQALAGTSMATPIAAGLIACMRQAHKQLLGQQLTVTEVKNMMSMLGLSQKSNSAGYGVLTWQIYEDWMKSKYGIQV